MARKPVLEGGRKDEIIKKASVLFFNHGYEATSIRMILKETGGEIGMFYHYFKSKEELFEKVVEYFFNNFQIQFSELIARHSDIDGFLPEFLDYYRSSIEQYNKLSGSMHWTIQTALAAQTIQAAFPSVLEFVQRYALRHPLERPVPFDIIAMQLLYAVSGTLHSESFQNMDNAKQQEVLKEVIELLLVKSEGNLSGR